jgi:hypothetical protein
MDAFLLDQRAADDRAKYQKRYLTDEDYDSFDQAADQRQPQLSRGKIEAELNRRNHHRMWRLRRDYRWVQKQMGKMGLNPEDARWLL